MALQVRAQQAAAIVINRRASLTLARRRAAERPLASSLRRLRLGGCRWLLRARAWLLYHYQPFDRTVFGKLSMVPSVLVLVLSSWPGWTVRAALTPRGCEPWPQPRRALAVCAPGACRLLHARLPELAAQL